jgi:hypothetical protein
MRLDVPHTFDVYEGDHGNRIRQRFEMNVLVLLAPAYGTLTSPRAGGGCWGVASG